MPVRLRPDLEEEFEALLDGNDLLRDFYAWVDSMNATYVSPHVALSAEGMIAAQYHIPEIGPAVMTLYQHAIGLRATLLLNECIHALNDDRMYSFVLTARSLLETGAGVVHYLGKLTEHAEAFPKDPAQALEFIRTLDMGITGSRFAWSDFVKGGASREALREQYAQTAKVASPASPTNVAGMVEKLERKLKATFPALGGTTNMAYAMLSDMCHPAVGGNLLIWSLDEERIVITGSYDLPKRKLLIKTVLPTLLICGGIILPAFEEMSALLETITTPFKDLPP